MTPRPPKQPVADLRVTRYALDGGHSPREWAKAVAEARIDPATPDGATVRVGVQITKARAVDVVVRIERLDTLPARIRAALGRSESDRLYRSKAARRAAGLGRPLALLTARMDGRPARLLITQPPG